MYLEPQVLEDNAYERRSQAQSAGEAMEVEEPDDEQPTPQLQQAPVHVAARVAANGVARMAARRAGPIAPAAQVAEASGQPPGKACLAVGPCRPAEKCMDDTQSSHNTRVAEYHCGRKG